jgi:hypothetical protein
MQYKRLTNRPILTNPQFQCPDKILRRQVALPVPYYGFDQQLHDGVIEIHRAVAEDVKALFELICKLGFPVEKVAPASDPAYRWDDKKLMKANVSSGFNYRLVAGTGQVSLHGRGLAIDINPRQNPYIRFKEDKVLVYPAGAVWDTSKPGTLFRGHPLVKFMAERGWEWGGDWTEQSGRIDYQHFQKPSTT